MAFLISRTAPNKKRERAYTRYFKAKKRYITALYQDEINNSHYPIWLEVSNRPDMKTTQLVQMQSQKELQALDKNLVICVMISELEMARRWFRAWARKVGQKEYLD